MILKGFLSFDFNSQPREGGWGGWVRDKGRKEEDCWMDYLDTPQRGTKTTEIAIAAAYQWLLNHHKNYREAMQRQAAE